MEAAPLTPADPSGVARGGVLDDNGEWWPDEPDEEFFQQGRLMSLPDWVVPDGALPPDELADARHRAWAAAVRRDRAARLAATPVKELSDDALLDAARLAARDAARARGRMARVMAEFTRRRPPISVRRQVITSVQQAAAELAPELALGVGTVSDELSVSVLLRDRLPATLAELEAGRLDWTKARVLAEAVAPLTAAQAREVEARVLPHAARRTPALHRAAVQRAVTAVDPAGARERRRQRKRDVELVRMHHGDGLATLLATLRSEQAELVHHAADLWARRRKAAGDPRTLTQLRVHALVQWAGSFIAHGDSTHCDRFCDAPAPDVEDGGAGPRDDDPDVEDGGAGPRDDDPDGNGGGHGCTGDPGDDGDEVDPVTGEIRAAARTAPTRHGRPARLRLLWDLRSLLGLAHHPGELLDSAVALDAATMRDLVTRGVRLRRMLLDAGTGELVDLSPVGVRLGSGHDGDIVELFLTVARDIWTLDRRGAVATADAALAAALAAAPDPVRRLLALPESAADLESAPERYRATARLAEFLCLRYRHPANPAAPATSAATGDLDHHTPHASGGPSGTGNEAPFQRRWHRLKTFTSWAVRRDGSGVIWTSPTGRSYRINPYDYRAGP